MSTPQILEISETGDHALKTHGQPEKEIGILIIDDDETISEAMRRYIEMFGYQTFVAQNAEDALETLKQLPIQVIITDIVLPGMDGLELTDQVKKNYDVDIIVMTGFSTEYSYKDAIFKGASDFVFKPIRFEEILLRVKRVLNERLLRAERSRMLMQLEKLAITDGLTRLYNSRHFYNQLKMEMERANRYGHPLSLLLSDIDYFKQYNDAYGHLKGDKVLAKVGKIILSCLRKVDSGYRYGGEEFTIILPETAHDEAACVAQRITSIIEAEPFIPEEGKFVNISISTGVAEYNPNEEINTFIQRVDQAMYISKQNGRNRITVL